MDTNINQLIINKLTKLAKAEHIGTIDDITNGVLLISERQIRGIE